MKLNEDAKAALRYAGVAQAEWARANFSSDGRWHGDACGCPDDRCIGYHHDDGEECGCLRTLLPDYCRGEGVFATARGGAGTAGPVTPRPAAALDPAVPLPVRAALLAGWWEDEAARLLAPRPGDSPAVAIVRQQRGHGYAMCAADLRAVLAAGIGG